MDRPPAVRLLLGRASQSWTGGSRHCRGLHPRATYEYARGGTPPRALRPPRKSRRTDAGWVTSVVRSFQQRRIVRHDGIARDGAWPVGAYLPLLIGNAGQFAFRII